MVKKMNLIEIDKLMMDIGNKSNLINRLADSATELIEDLEKKLNDAQVGIVIWNCDYFNINDHFGFGDVESIDDMRLGFGRVDGHWGFVVSKKYNHDDIIRLRNCSRLVRILAVSFIPDLLMRINKKLNKMVEIAVTEWNVCKEE